MNELTFFQIGNQINQINKLKDKIKKASFEELAVGYEKLKPYEKSVSVLTKAVRDEIVENKFQSKNCGIKEDEKGNRFYKNLQLSNRVSYTLDENYAKKILNQLNLQDKVIEKIPKITELKEFLEILKSILSEKQWTKLENNYIQYSIEFNKEKYDNLLYDKKISVQDKTFLKEAYVRKETPVLNVKEVRNGL